MPIYEFRCDACDSLFEQILPIGGRSQKKTCPECGRSARHAPDKDHGRLLSG